MLGVVAGSRITANGLSLLLGAADIRVTGMTATVFSRKGSVTYFLESMVNAGQMQRAYHTHCVLDDKRRRERIGGRQMHNLLSV